MCALCEYGTDITEEHQTDGLTGHTWLFKMQAMVAHAQEPLNGAQELKLNWHGPLKLKKGPA